MARAGIASRRKSEEFIERGVVQVNGKVVCEMGVKIDPEVDKVVIDGKKLKIEKQGYVYYALNKPRGYVSAAIKNSAVKSEKIITELVPKNPRVFPVGRLDKDSDGLIILTNDGQLTFKLTHPSQEHEKEYLVTVKQVLQEGALNKLRAGMNILGQKTKPAVVTKITQNKFKIVLQEGKNRQIRRMCRKVGWEVLRLTRIRIGQFFLKNIKLGEYRQLAEKELFLLKS